MQVDPDFSGLVRDEYAIKMRRALRIPIRPSFLQNDANAAIVETVNRCDFVFVGAMYIGPLEDDLVECVSCLRQVVATMSQSPFEVGAENCVVFVWGIIRLG